MPRTYQLPVVLVELPPLPLLEFDDDEDDDAAEDVSAANDPIDASAADCDWRFASTVSMFANCLVSRSFFCWSRAFNSSMRSWKSLFRVSIVWVSSGIRPCSGSVSFWIWLV